MSAFDELVKNQGGELSEKFARDSGTLGALITRHISEFDRTVKTFGGEIVDRMGQRTQDIADTLKTYVDTFDTRLTSNGGEITASLDQRLVQFETTLETRVAGLDTSLDSKIRILRSKSVDGRLKSLEQTFDTRAKSVTETIDNRLGTLATSLTDGAAQAIYSIDARLTQLTSSLTDGTAQAIEAVDQRISNVTETIDGRSAQSDRHHHGAVPGNPSGHRNPGRRGGRRHRHARRAVRGPAGFAHRGRGRPHREQRTAGQRWPDGPRRGIVARDQVPRRGCGTLADQPRGQYQRDHPDRRPRRATITAFGFLRRRRPVEADLGGSRARPHRRRYRCGRVRS